MTAQRVLAFCRYSIASLWLAAVCVGPAFASTKAAYMHYLKALLLEHQGDPSGALQEYQAASMLDPQSSYILEQAVELALETGQSSRAMDLALRLQEMDPKNSKARLLLGNVYWARGEMSKAQASFEDALKINPKYSEAMFALGNLLNAQSPDKAKRYFQDYLEANPERAAEAHFQIALVDERMQRTQEAVRHLKEAARLEPDFLQARYTLAHIYEVLKDTDAALGEYLGVLEREPDNVSLLNHVGELFFLKGDPESAQGYFQRSRNTSPRDPGACLWLAILAERKGDFSRAAELLAESSALKDEPELSLRLSYYLTQANRIQEAIAVLEEAHKKWPDNNEISYFLSLGYDDSKQTEKSIALLKDVVQRAPQFRDARFQLAAFYEKLDQIDAMEREFRVLLAQRPDDSAALNYLGYSLTDRGLKLEEAEGFIQRAVALDPNNSAYLDSLGWSYFKQGRLPQALEALRSALRYGAEDPAIWDHLGDVQKAQGDVAGAWISWKRGLAYGPGDNKLLKKAAAAENTLPVSSLGERFMEYLRQLHGGIVRFSSLCEFSGMILNKPFHFTGLLSYEGGGALRLELLGPLFLPVFRAELDGHDAFSMDPLHLEGIPPEAAREAVYQNLRILRDYLSGSIFDERPARYRKGWSSRWIATASRKIFLDDAGQGMKGMSVPGDLSSRLFLGGVRAENGRRVPMDFKLEGRGFSIELRLSNPAVTYKRPSEVVP